MPHAKNFTPSQLKEALADCAQAEEDVKTGRLNEKMAVELIIVKYSAKIKSKIQKDFYFYETFLCFMLRIADKIIAMNLCNTHTPPYGRLPEKTREYNKQ